MHSRPLAIVTGAAHRLGRIFALTLAKQGYDILLHHHDSLEAAASTSEEIREHGGKVYIVQADLTLVDGVQTLCSHLKSIIDESQYLLRVVVNSAAYMKRREIGAITPEEWDLSLALNLRAPFFISQGTVPYMKKGGLIVNITDAGVQKLWVGYPDYTIGKSGLETLTKLQAKAFAPLIRVNAIAPGLAMQSVDMLSEEWDRLIKRLPLERQITPENLSSALVYLLENEVVTGQIIRVDGGFSLP
jgi:pteridine reductase